MKWWKGVLGLAKDGGEAGQKDHAWTPETGRAAFHDRDNFVTNRVTLADYTAGTANPLGLSATFACVGLIAGTVASLSPSIYRRVNGVRVEDREHPLFWMLRFDPNADDTDYDFWEFIAASIELQGNAYADKRRNGGRLTSLIPVSPMGMTVRRTRKGSREYEWVDEGGNRQVRREDDILHIRGFGGDRLKGCSTLATCARIFAGAVHTDLAADKVFANGVRPSGVLSLDDKLTPEQRSYLETILQEKFVGAMNAGRPMVLDGGVKWHALSLAPEDAELLESRKFSGEEICRIFGVPPAMVGYGDKASNWGTGKEVDVLGFIKFTLRKRLRRIERALMKQLLTRQERMQGVTIEFNLEGLLRGDSDGRSKFYQLMTMIGAMTINEVRALENMPPVEGGEVPRMQMQNVPITRAGQEEQ